MLHSNASHAVFKRFFKTSVAQCCKVFVADCYKVSDYQSASASFEYRSPPFLRLISSMVKACYLQRLFLRAPFFVLLPVFVKPNATRNYCHHFANFFLKNMCIYLLNLSYF